MVRITSLLAVAALASAATAPQQNVLVTYPENTPSHIMDQAKDAIRTAGGVITHEFSLIKGFSATAAKSALESINALSTEFMPSIENDGEVTIQGQGQ